MTTTTPAPRAPEPGTATAAPRQRPHGVLPVLGVALPGSRSFAVWYRHLMVFLPQWRAELIAPAIEPIIVFLAMGLGLGAYISLGDADDDYIRFLAPGVLAMFPMFAGTFDALFGTYRRLHEEGTYEAILATPTRAEEAITGDVLWAATRSVLSASAILLVVLILTPYYDLMDSPLGVLALVVAGLEGVIFAALGLAYASRAGSISQLGYYFSLFTVPMFWLGGGFFPLDELPTWAQAVAWFLPLTHATELNRDLLHGPVDWSTLGRAAWLLIATVPAMWIALRVMRTRLIPD